MPHRSLRLCSLFTFFFFLFTRLNNFHWPYFKLTGSFYCLLKSAFEPLKCIFHLSHFNFQVQNSFLVPFHYFPLLISSFCPCFLLALKSLSIMCDTYASSGMFPIDLFCSVEWVTFHVSLYALWYFAKNWILEFYDVVTWEIRLSFPYPGFYCFYVIVAGCLFAGNQAEVKV